MSTGRLAGDILGESLQMGICSRLRITRRMVISIVEEDEVVLGAEGAKSQVLSFHTSSAREAGGALKSWLYIM